MKVEDVQQTIAQHFEFLVTDFGLQGPHIKRHTTTIFSLAYLNKEFGVQVLVELNDFLIFLLLFKANGDEMPEGYRDAGGGVENGTFRKFWNSLERLINTKRRRYSGWVAITGIAIFSQQNLQLCSATTGPR